MEAEFFFFRKRAGFKICDAFDLLLGGALLAGGDAVCADGISAVVMLRYADGDEFLVETGQCAIGKKWFEEPSDALSDFGAVGENFKHIGDDAARGEKRIVNFLRVDGGRFAFE